MSTAVRVRAAAALNVSADSTAGEATSAFLASLTETKFVPPGNSVAALNTLAGLAIPAGADSSPTLREEVEEFAHRYWTLSPAERLAVWLALSTRCPDDATAERLVTLQAGLEVPGIPLPGASEERIAAIARLLYVMPPRERAIRRNAWLVENAVWHTEQIEAAAAIRKNHPSVVSLDPDLFERLVPRFHTGLFADTATISTVPEVAYPSPKPIVYPPPRRIPPPPKDSKKPVGAYMILVGIGLLLLLRALNSGSTGSPHPSTMPGRIPSYYAPQFDSTSKEFQINEKPPRLVSPTIFSQSQVDAFRAYERDRSKPVPPSYKDWVLVGKPKAYERVFATPEGGSPGRFVNPAPEGDREK